MAEADQDPTSPFAIPPPVRITLPEAVDLIELNSDAVWNALLVALGDGRLSAGDHRPEYFSNLPYREFALRGMPQADLDAIRYFREIPSGSWRLWIAEDGSIVRKTGEVLRHFPDYRGLIIFQPTLLRIDVLAHFMMARPAAPVQPVSPKPKLELAEDDAVREALKIVYAQYATGQGPNINDVVRLVRDQLEARSLEATKDDIQRIADEPEFKKKRRPPGKHRE